MYAIGELLPRMRAACERLSDDDPARIALPLHLLGLGVARTRGLLPDDALAGCGDWPALRERLARHNPGGLPLPAAEAALAIGPLLELACPVGLDPAELGRGYSLLLAGEARHRAGVHYTPPEIARRLAQAVLDDRTLTVCDPAMGCGAFLLAAAGCSSSVELHGIDRDPLAAGVARLALWLAGRSATLRVADALLDGDATGGAFDAVLANPPYVENKRLDRAYKTALRGAGYRCLKGLWDLSLPFVERCLQLLRPGGRLGLVLPNKLCTREYAGPLRRMLAAEHELLELADVSGENLFDGAGVYPILAVLRKRAPRRGHRVTIVCRDASSHRRAQSALARTPGGIWPLSGDGALVDAVLRAADGRARSLGEDLGRRVYRPLGFRWAPLLDTVRERPAKGALRFIGCGSLAPLRIDWGRPLRLQRRTFERAWLARPPGTSDACWGRFGRPQILVRELARELTAAPDPHGEYAHLTGIYAFTDLPPEFPPEYLAGLLCSDLLRRFYADLYWNTHLAGGYLDFKGSYLARLPILPAPRARREEIVELVRAIGRDDCPASWKRLDAAVAALYGL